MTRRVIWLAFASSLLSTVAIFGVGAAQPAAVNGDPTAPPPPGQQVDPVDHSPADVARRAKAVATIGERELTVGEVEDAIAAQSPFQRSRFSDPAKMREFVDSLIRFELLGAEAERRGLNTGEAVIKATKQNSVQRLIHREFDERITAESIPDEDIAAYYQEHVDEFRTEEMVRASHILLDTRERAVELIRELANADARAFREAARAHSRDTETKLRGGDLRFFNREGLMANRRDANVDAAIVDAAFELRAAGDMTRAPVAVGDNWSIIKLTGRREATEQTLEERSPSIRLRMWRERRQEAIEAFVRELKTRMAPEVHEERMSPIRLETSPDEETGGGFAPGGGHGMRHRGAEVGRPGPSMSAAPMGAAPMGVAPMGVAPMGAAPPVE